MTTTRTTNLRIPIPDFTQSPWHAEMRGALLAIDNAIYRALILSDVALWTNATDMLVGNVRIDAIAGSLWVCRVSHTSAVAPALFSADRVAHPTFWTAFASSYNPRGPWANNTAYSVYDVVYSVVEGILAHCVEAHVSAVAPATITDDPTKWVFWSVLPANTVASGISFDNAGTGYVNDDVQGVLEEQSAVNDLLDSRLNTVEAEDAPLDSPAFINNPTAPTQAELDNSTKLATTAYADRAAWKTGDMKLTFSTVADTGWVIADDGTIGNAASGASNRANADTANLYSKLWGQVSDTFAPVTGGRGANAAADFAANKKIALTKMLGRLLLIAGAGAGLTSRALGETLGGETFTIASGNLPQLGVTITDPTHLHTASPVGTSGGAAAGGGGNQQFTTISTSSSATGITATANTGGANTAINKMNPVSGVKIMIRL